LLRKDCVESSSKCRNNSPSQYIAKKAKRYHQLHVNHCEYEAEIHIQYSGGQ
jgi:hypothetical protein